jgi:hypothetical protein
VRAGLKTVEIGRFKNRALRHGDSKDWSVGMLSVDQASGPQGIASLAR